MLDIQITQGSYWKGAQIPYWIYMVLTIFPFTGLFGVDHFVLRSPMTAVLKIISIIPLFGFWYFYDIAQSTGQRELVEKYGISVPLYGPTGIGAGIFSGSKDVPLAPKEIPGPWLYMAYAITTLVFIAFPINKFVIGDYMGGLSQILMYICIFTVVTPFLAIIWGFYDIYRVLFDTRGIFEKGAARFFPASWFVGDYFRRNAMGPFEPEPAKPATSWIGRLFEAWMEVPIVSAKAVTGVIKTADAVAVGSTGIATQEVGNTMKESSAVVSDTIKSAKVASEAVTGTVEKGAKAADGIASLLEKIPEIGNKVASELPDKIAAQAAQVHKGGAFFLENSPSISTTALMFSLALLGFSGYVFYTLRNLDKKTTEKSDDPPRDPGTVRGPSKSSE